MTRTEDLKHKVQEATEKGLKLAKLVCAMQRGTQEQSSQLLARLRVGASVDDLLDPETDPDRFPEYMRNGTRGSHAYQGSSRGISSCSLFTTSQKALLTYTHISESAASPPDEQVPLSANSSHSFDFSMPALGLSPVDIDQANEAFKKGFSS